MTNAPDYGQLGDDDAPNRVAMGERAWTHEADWGIWGIPQSPMPLLPDDVAGKRAIEPGCGT